MALMIAPLARHLWLILSLCAGAASATPRGFAVSSTPMSLPVFVAQDQRMFEAQGLSLRFEQCISGKRCLDRLLDGKVDLCTAADLPVAMASFRSRNLAVVATIATDPNDAKIIARRSGAIHTGADLRGRTVGVSIGTSSQYFLDSLALLSGVDPSSLRLLNLDAEQMWPALRDGRVDAVASFEPAAFELARALGSDALVLRSRHLYTLTWNVVVSGEMAAAGDADTLKLLRALDSAIDFIHREPGRAQAILKRRLGLEDASVSSVWPDLAFELELQQSLIKTMEGEARWALRSGQVQGLEPNYLDRVHEGPLVQLKADSVGIVR